MCCKNGVYVQCVQMRENANEMIEWVNVVVSVIELCYELRVEQQQLQQLQLQQLLPKLLQRRPQPQPPPPPSPPPHAHPHHPRRRRRRRASSSASHGHRPPPSPPSPPPSLSPSTPPRRAASLSSLSPVVAAGAVGLVRTAGVRVGRGRWPGGSAVLGPPWSNMTAGGTTRRGLGGGRTSNCLFGGRWGAKVGGGGRVKELEVVVGLLIVAQ